MIINDTYFALFGHVQEYITNIKDRIQIYKYILSVMVIANGGGGYVIQCVHESKMQSYTLN